MIRRSFLAGLAAVAGASIPTASAQTSTGAVTVRSAWSRATPGGSTVGVGYLDIQNTGSTPDRLTRVSSEIATRAELHESVMDGSVAQMRPVEAIPVEANGAATLKPGGHHLMFMGLKRPLRDGDRFRATLHFERAGPIEAEFAVRGIGAAQGGPHHAH
jgi:copper(I)-binding protein